MQERSDIVSAGEATQLIVKNGHLLVRRDGLLDLIDTGSPFTMAAPEMVSEAVGEQVDRILGTDELAKEIVIFDLAAGVVTFNAEDPAEVAWLAAPSMLGVPQLRVSTPMGEAMALLDTGAWLGYGPAEAMADRPMVREVEDFHPMLNEPLLSRVYRLPIALAGREVELEMGVLPPALGGLLAMIGCAWIVGPSLFEGRRLVLDLGHQRIADLPGAAGK